MYRIDELEEHLKCTYPHQVNNATQDKRLTDISALQTMIAGAIADNSLKYQVKEERVQIFKTQKDEKIFIQYPGKESIAEGKDRRPFDFRPRIMTADGTMVRDLVFADMWGLVESLNHLNHQMLKLMACIFFRLGRMTFHRYEDRDCPCELLDRNENVISTTTRHLSWYEFFMEPEIVRSLNFHSPSLMVDGTVSISLEAFLCFFELLLHNEDSKYYDKKHDLTSGRIPTSDSMLLLSSALYGKISLSVLLQRFVSGRGVARCQTNEIEVATDGLVKIVNIKKEVIQLLKNQGVSFREGSTITVNRISYRAAIKIPEKKIVVLSKDSDEARSALESRGWEVYILDDFLDEAILDEVKSKVV